MADSEETRNEAERQELLEDNKRMWEDVVRLRKWKGSVDEENARLKAERVQLKLEATRLREETTRLREERAASQTETLRLRDEVKTLREDAIRAQEKEASRASQVLAGVRRLSAMLPMQCHSFRRQPRTFVETMHKRRCRWMMTAWRRGRTRWHGKGRSK